MHGSGGESLLHLSDLVTQIRSRLSFDKTLVKSDFTAADFAVSIGKINS